MAAFDSTVWSRLDSGRAWGERLVAFRASPDGSDSILAAVDAGGHRHILVHLEPQWTGFEDRTTRGLEVCTRELVLDGGATGRFIDLKCLELDGRGVFDRMGSDIAERLSRRSGPPSSVVQDVLQSWRRFWSISPSAALSASEQVGLFGELWFLALWLAESIGLEASVLAWRGPHGAINDFEFPKLAWEVKATVSASGHVHTIAGLDQLDCAPEAELFLFSLRLREDAGASNSLSGLVKMVRDALDRSGGPIAEFEGTLRAAGYSDTHEEFYRSRTFRVVTEYLYRVTDGFPRIVPSSFGGAPPPGVRTVKYEIDLSGFGHLVICGQPREFADFVSDRWPSLSCHSRGRS